jgi:hypothetical protein
LKRVDNATLSIPRPRGRTSAGRRRKVSRRAFSLQLESLEVRRVLSTVAFANGYGTAGITATAEAVAMDTTGNSYVTGSFTGTISFGSFHLTSPNPTFSAYVAKLDTGGNVVWAHTIASATSTNGDYGRGITVDSSGNVYVTGFYDGAATLGGINLPNAGGYDAFVTKLDNTGNFLWAKGFGGAQNDKGQHVAVDGAGNVYTTGNYQGTANFGPSTTLTSTGVVNIYVVKQDSAGNVVWAKSMGSNDTTDPLGQSGFGLALDGSGNIYTTGVFRGAGVFGAVNLTSFGDVDSFVAKMDNSGTVLWAKQFGGTGHDDGTSIAVDGAGNVYATGDYVGSGSFGGVTLTSAGLDDAYIARLDAAGTVAWAKSLGGSGADAGFGVAVDGAGNIYDTGIFQGTASVPGRGTLTSFGGFDVFLVKLDPTGSFTSAQSFGSAGDEVGYQVAVGGPNNNITVVGSYSGAFTVGNYGLPAAGTAYVIQYSQVPPAPVSKPPSDFLNLGYSQVAVFRPSTAQWFALGPNSGQLLGTFGGKNLLDIPVAGDFDGTGHTELAVFRPSTAQWFVLSPTGGRLIGTFGDTNLRDIPVPGDYDGTGHTELAVFRPATAQWFVLGPTGGHLLGTFGATNLRDIPVPGDYDATGHTEMAVFRPATAQWYVMSPSGGRLLNTFGDTSLRDIPVPGDYDATGHTEIAVFRKSTAEWFVLGPNGSHKLTIFGATNLFDIPTEAPAGAIVKLGVSSMAVVGNALPPGPIGLSAVSVPGLVSTPVTIKSAAAPTHSVQAPAVSGRSAVVIGQGKVSSSASKDVWLTALEALDRE